MDDSVRSRLRYIMTMAYMCKGRFWFYTFTIYFIVSYIYINRLSLLYSEI